MSKILITRMIGFVASLVLTGATFLAVLYPDFFHLTISTTVLIILSFAVLQALVQSICFLHIWGEKGPPWNLIFFVSTIAMVTIVVVGSIWIMNHLNYNMKL